MTRLRSGLRSLYFAHRVRFSDIARILCCSHSVRISRGTNCLKILQFPQFVDCIRILKLGGSADFASGANRVDGFDCLRCSRRLNCSDCRDRFDCSDCPDCPRSPRGFHRARSPPGFDCSNVASDVARVTIFTRNRLLSGAIEIILRTWWCPPAAAPGSVGEFVGELLADFLDFRARVELAVRVVGVFLEVVLVVFLRLVEGLKRN